MYSSPLLGPLVKYGAAIMGCQAVILIAVEKISIFFPRMSQKLERFYKCVVEEALLGKDPDGAEDFSAGRLALLFRAAFK